MDFELHKQPKFKEISYNEKKIGNLEIKYIDNIFEYISNFKLPYEISEKNDIIKNIYEGGFKIWECTIDLLEYLEEKYSNLIFESKSVMDLGCGQGILGILALKNKANFVIFQDYNLEVLEYCTYINLKCNFIENEFDNKVAFFSGDWNLLSEKINKNKNEIKLNENNIEIPKKIDILLMSEVIYKTENYEKIANIINENLKIETGICFLASKVYYFGVGGSLPEFELFIKEKFPELEWIDVKEINNKKSNKRRIVQIRKLK